MRDFLVCPHCHGDFVTRPSGVMIGSDEVNFLVCNHCNTATPVIGSLYFFCETKEILEEYLPGQFDKFIQTINQPEEKYLQFLKTKEERQVYDIYAGMQPFNESSVAFEVFLEKIQERLKPNELILDTWCRTGWTPGYLRSFFPDNHIISVWEGNNDTMGYLGFRYWYGGIHAPANCTILFHHMSKPLPIRSETVGFVYGLDTMHRYDITNLMNETLRLRTKTGLVFFPHVHLTNFEPDPWFERGGVLRHGKQYDHYFKGRLAGTGLTGVVLPEPVLYDKPESVTAVSTPDQKEYNGLLAVLPEDFEFLPLKKRVEHDFSDKALKVIINPAIKLDLHRGIAELDPAYRNKTVEYFLIRHPIFKKQFQNFPVELNALECKILFLAGIGLSIGIIQQFTQVSDTELDTILEGLCNQRICSVFHVPDRTFELQYLHSTQKLKIHIDRMTLGHLWTDTVSKYPDQVWLVNGIDGSGYTYSQSDELIHLIKNRLMQDGLGAGKYVLIRAPLHEEFALTVWAVILAGGIAVPVDPDLPDDALGRVLQEVNPVITFLQKPANPEFTGNILKVVLFDSGDMPAVASGISFSDWLEGYNGQVYPVETIMPDQDAVVLFTSGTTNKPKGVRLSHRALFRSALNVVHSFHFTQDTRFFSPGDAFTMSGLRNPLFAVAMSGGSVILAPKEERLLLRSILELMYKNQVTDLATVPAFLRQVISMKDSIELYLFSKLKQVLCTGTALPAPVRSDFESLVSIPVLNYYGLTETSGICIAQLTGAENSSESIGYPVDCLAQIFSPDGELVRDDSPGELKIFSINLLTGYKNNPDNCLENGYFSTGDLVTRSETGEYFIKGRIKEIIKTRDGNVLIPDEIESVISSSSFIQEAAIFGVIKPNGDEEIIAAIVLTGNSWTPEMETEVNGRITTALGQGKIPSLYWTVPDLPKGVNGKILRKQLAEIFNNKTK